MANWRKERFIESMTEIVNKIADSKELLEGQQFIDRNAIYEDIQKVVEKYLDDEE